MEIGVGHEVGRSVEAPWHGPLFRAICEGGRADADRPVRTYYRCRRHDESRRYAVDYHLPLGTIGHLQYEHERPSRSAMSSERRRRGDAERNEWKSEP